METTYLFMRLLTELGDLGDGCPIYMSRLTALSQFRVSFSTELGSSSAAKFTQL
jgi:hypothetical protein